MIYGSRYLIEVELLEFGGGAVLQVTCILSERLLLALNHKLPTARPTFKRR